MEIKAITKMGSCKDYMDPHLNMKRSRYAEKESERYAGDWMYFLSYQGT